MRFGVAMIAQVFYPSVGGAQTHTLRLSQKLRAAGIDVVVLTRHHKGLLHYEEVEGVPTYRVGKGGGNKAVAALSYVAGSLHILHSLRNRIHIIHSHQMISPMTIGLMARAISNKRLVINPHRSGSLGDVGILTLRRPLTGRPRILAARRMSDAFVCISPAVHQELADLGMRKEQLWDIANGVDVEHFSPLASSKRAEQRRELQLPTGNIVMFAGRLVAEKGVNILLQSWPAVKAAVQDAHLVLIGEGDKKTELQELTRQLGLQETVTFVPSTANVAPYLQVADAFVLPSFAEGLPVALLEAMAVGLPCIATATSGSLQLIEDYKTGRVVPIGEVEPLARAITDALTLEEAHQWGANARQRVIANNSLDAVTHKYIEMYERILGPQHART